MTPDQAEAINELTDLADGYAPDFYGTVPNADAIGLRELVADYACNNSEAPAYNRLTYAEQRPVLAAIDIPTP